MSATDEFRTVPRGRRTRRKTWRTDDTGRYEDVNSTRDRLLIEDERVRTKTVRFVDNVDYGDVDRKDNSTGSLADDAREVGDDYEGSVDEEDMDEEELYVHLRSKEEKAERSKGERTVHTVSTQAHKRWKVSAAARTERTKLKEFEQALDEVVADDDQFLKMIRENRTRLARDTKDWTYEYSLDNQTISSMAQKLMQGDLQHLYADLPPQQRATVEETLSRMHQMSLEELMDSIAAVD